VKHWEKSLCNLELIKDHSITVAERRNDYQVDEETQEQSSQRLRGWSSKQLVRIGRSRLSWGAAEYEERDKH
jgi:hypothetical protein